MHIMVAVDNPSPSLCYAGMIAKPYHATLSGTEQFVLYRS